MRNQGRLLGRCSSASGSMRSHQSAGTDEHSAYGRPPREPCIEGVSGSVIPKFSFRVGIRAALIPFRVPGCAGTYGLAPGLRSSGCVTQLSLRWPPRRRPGVTAPREPGNPELKPADLPGSEEIGRSSVSSRDRASIEVHLLETAQFRRAGGPAVRAVRGLSDSASSTICGRAESWGPRYASTSGLATPNFSADCVCQRLLPPGRDHGSGGRSAAEGGRFLPPVPAVHPGGVPPRCLLRAAAGRECRDPGAPGRLRSADPGPACRARLRPPGPGDHAAVRAELRHTREPGELPGESRSRLARGLRELNPHFFSRSEPSTPSSSTGSGTLPDISDLDGAFLAAPRPHLGRNIREIGDEFIAYPG